MVTVVKQSQPQPPPPQRQEEQSQGAEDRAQHGTMLSDKALGNGSAFSTLTT